MLNYSRSSYLTRNSLNRYKRATSSEAAERGVCREGKVLIVSKPRRFTVSSARGDPPARARRRGTRAYAKLISSSIIMFTALLRVVYRRQEATRERLPPSVRIRGNNKSSGCVLRRGIFVAVAIVRSAAW